MTVSQRASPTAPRLAGRAAARPVILVAGNPNSGKSTLFNALTGASAKVSNYPGVTVTRTSARTALPDLGDVELVDLPGTYSLSARSRDEQVAVDAVLGRGGAPPDLILIVADATALSRNLYLINEIVETGTPVVVALNMIDEAEGQGLEIDAAQLSAEVGAHVVPVVARHRQGLDALKRAMADALQAPVSPLPASLDSPAGADIDALAAVVAREWPAERRAARAWAVWLLLSIDETARDELVGIPAPVREAAAARRANAAGEGRNLDLEVIGARYRRVDAIVETVARQRPSSGPSWTERVDAVLTHRLWGFLTFVVVMLALFQALFSWSEPAIGLIEDQVARVQLTAGTAMPPGPLRDLLVNGVVAGVGNVLVFVPQIALLFLFIGVMEDVGYLARVAFVIDRLMGRIGLHGKSFVPMLSGFSCAVPAVMATRTLEHRTDRMLTMMVLPLMSCSARLPIYVLIIATVFNPQARVLGVASTAAVTLFSMYFLSVAAALGAAAVLRRTVLRGPRPTLMLELPPYRLPQLRVLFRSTWRQVRSFLVDAGTIILALTIVVWAVLSYPKNPQALAALEQERTAVEGMVDEEARAGRLAAIESRARGVELRSSLGGRLGHAIEPLIEPLGFDWRIGVGILGAFTAREVFVSTMGIVFDVGEADETSQSLREELRSARRADGSRLMTPLTGVSLMVFFVLACQCMSTLAVVRRESGSWRWPAFMFAYQTAMAYVAALIVYQVGSLFGWGV